MQTIAIIGLGLMGGSIAKALKRSGKYQVFGFDTSGEVLNAALEQGVLDGVAQTDEYIDADITILAVEPRAALSLIEQLPGKLKKGSILTDICGIKGKIVSFGESVCEPLGISFVGGHPMAGREKSGFEFSDENLFYNRSYILTKTKNTNPAALDKLSKMAEDIGCADVTVTSPEHHDKMIAYTSQLPHILAGAYINSPTSVSHKGYSAGSYHDVSRVASVDENLWTQLFAANKGNLLFEIDILIKNLEGYRSAIEEEDAMRLQNIIRTGRILKERDIILNGSEKPHKFG